MLWFQPPVYLILAWHVALWGHSFPQWPSSSGFEVTLSLLSFQSILLLFLCILFWLSHKRWEAPRLHLGHLSTSIPLTPRISNRPVNSAILSMFSSPAVSPKLQIFISNLINFAEFEKPTRVFKRNLKWHTLSSHWGPVSCFCCCRFQLC